MSWLDDLVKGARQLAGNAVDVYGTTRNFPESNVSEWLAGGPTMNSLVGKVKASDESVPVGDSSSDNAIQISSPDANGMAKFSDGSTRYVGGGQKTDTGGDKGGGTGGDKGGGTGGIGGGGGIDLNAVMNARRSRNEGSINSFLDSARGLKDEILGMVGKKRDQYKQLFNEGDQNITQTFEGEKGNDRRTFQDLASTEGNRARALGLGGSATDYADSRRLENLGRQLGDVNTNASNNRMENKRTLDNRNDTADTWERSALRDYGTAEDKAREAKNSLLDTEENTVLGWLGSVLNNQLALNATKAGIGADVANPYAVDTSKLTNFLNPGLTGAGATDATGGGAVQDGNPVDISTLAQLMNPNKYKSGLYGTGYTG